VTTAANPATQLVSIPVEVRQPFNKYVMTIWVDDRLNFNHEIQSEKKKRFLHTETADYMTLIQLPVGEHSLRVQITAVGESFEGDGKVSTRISEISGQKLLVRCDKTHKQVQVALN
jgi:hypothetical protein